MPPSALRIPDIAGLECIDADRSLAYKVDADGKQVGPARPESVYQIGGSNPGEALSPPPAASREPVEWWVWLLLASAVALAVGAVLRFVRHRRAQRA